MNDDAKALLEDLFLISQVAAVLSLAGAMTIEEHRLLANALQVWAVYFRKGKNKTHTAIALRRSRRAIRTVVNFIESDEGPIPETVRRVLRRDPVRPSFDEIVADLSHGDFPRDDDGSTKGGRA